MRSLWKRVQGLLLKWRTQKPIRKERDTLRTRYKASCDALDTLYSEREVLDKRIQKELKTKLGLKADLDVNKEKLDAVK